MAEIGVGCVRVSAVGLFNAADDWEVMEDQDGMAIIGAKNGEGLLTARWQVCISHDWVVTWGPSNRRP